MGYEELYQVSDMGRVRSVDRVVSHGRGGLRKLKGRILRPFSISRLGHTGVDLRKEGTRRTIYIHRLVAAAWIGPCPDGQQVRHGSNGVADNSVSNLCYGTISDNHFDKRRDGTHGGKAVRRSDGIEFINMCMAAEETDCRANHIGAVCRGQRRTTGGYGWEYV